MNGRTLQDEDGAILIVCTGNVCRSPYIERLLSARLAGTNITVTSAGTAALTGSNMDPQVADRLSLTGCDSEGFSARPLTVALATDADLILCATRQHRSQVVQLTPKVLRRTYALADFSDIASSLVGITIPAHAGTGTFVRGVAAAAEQARANVQPRTRERAEIVDPFRQPKKVFEQMFAQVERLLPPIVAVLTGSSPEPISVREHSPVA